VGFDVPNRRVKVSDEKLLRKVHKIPFEDLCDKVGDIVKRYLAGFPEPKSQETGTPPEPYEILECYRFCYWLKHGRHPDEGWSPNMVDKLQQGELGRIAESVKSTYAALVEADIIL
jgi:hypothetical protein